MFEKRAAVYREVSETFARGANEGTFSLAQIRHLEGLGSQVRFLYADDKVNGLLTDAINHAAELYRPPPPTKIDNFGREVQTEPDLHANYRRQAIAHHIASKMVGPQPGMISQDPASTPWLASAIWFSKNSSKRDEATLPFLRVFH